MSETIKVIDGEKKKQNKKIKTEKNMEHKSYTERVRAKWFSCAFRIDFLQLICKDSLIFKSNLQLGLAIMLKEREIY